MVIMGCSIFYLFSEAKWKSVNIFILSGGHMDVMLFSVMVSFQFKLYNCTIRFPQNLEGILDSLLVSSISQDKSYGSQRPCFAGDHLFLSLCSWSCYFTTIWVWTLSPSSYQIFVNFPTWRLMSFSSKYLFSMSSLSILSLPFLFSFWISC